jgi:CO/xanthine dehydrogenase Mo-binding subunit
VTAIDDVGVVFEDELRADGREKVSGRAAYSADFTAEGMLWAAFATSPMAHATIVAIDTAAARAMPGVHAVLTGSEIGERRFGRVLFDWPVLAIGKVRFIGEYVAAVAAETPEQARAAAAAIDVRYAELPPIFDPALAIESNTLIHEDPGVYVYRGEKRPAVPHPNVQGHDVTVVGDVDSAFAEASAVFEHTFTTPRYFAGYIEPRATLVWIDANDVAHFVSTNKSPFDLRDQLATTTGLPPERIVIEPAFIGGDFGSKGTSIDEFPCYYLALATRRPIKYVRSYLDDMKTTVVRHASTITLKSAVDALGRFVALDARLVYDGGAYAAGRPIPTLLPGGRMKTPYLFHNSRIERIGVYTNSVPAGQVRDPAGTPLVFAVESHVDMIARELGIDPLEFRLRNVIRGEGRDVDGGIYADPRGEAVLEALRDAVRWGPSPPPGRGRGISLVSRHVGGGKTSLRLFLSANGIVEVRTGFTEQGVGTLTLAARVIAKVLGVETTIVHVARGTTAEVPHDPGPGGSRGAHVVGQAAYDAAQQLRIVLSEAGYPGIGWHCAVERVCENGPVEIVGAYDDKDAHARGDWHNFCAYCAEVSVDEETGALTIHDVVFVADVGTIINPVAHRGQLDGGFAFGLGHALTEELQLDDGRIVNPSLADYKLPTQRDMPPFRVVHVHTDRGPGPFGAKMAGELSTSSVPATVANAIADACGVRLTALPLTSERILNGLAAKRAH